MKTFVGSVTSFKEIPSDMFSSLENQILRQWRLMERLLLSAWTRLNEVIENFSFKGLTQEVRWSYQPFENA